MPALRASGASVSGLYADKPCVETANPCPSGVVGERRGGQQAGTEGGDALESELAALMVAVRQGCRTSFAQLYVLTSPRLFAAVLRINSDRAEAEDVLQEVYVKVWSRCVQFDTQKGLVNYWLTGIARNSAIDSLRRRGVRPQSGLTPTAVNGDPYAELPSDWLEPFEIVMRSRAADAVQQCLREFSNEQRECLTLSFYDGLSHEEIGRRIGRPVGTVKSWLRRSLLAMRLVLVGHD